MSSPKGQSRYSSSDSEEDWQPQVKTHKKNVCRRKISDDESELAGATSDDTSSASAFSSSVNVIKGSLEDIHGTCESSYEVIAATSSESDSEIQIVAKVPSNVKNIGDRKNLTYKVGSRNEDDASDTEHKSVQWSSTNSANSTQLVSDDEKENESPEHSCDNQRSTKTPTKSDDNPQINVSKTSVKASTPKEGEGRNVKGCFDKLQLTAIGKSSSRVRTLIPSDGSGSIGSSAAEITSVSEPSAQEDLHKSTSFRAPKPTGDDQVDLEQYIADGLMDITTKACKQFNFRQKQQSVANAALGATCGDYDSVEEIEEDDVSANSIFGDRDYDSGNEHYESPVAINTKKTQSGFGADKITSKFNTSDEIEILSEKLNKIPLGGRGKQPSKTIFLNDLPESRVELPKVYAYDPGNQKHQEFYGDVQRTIAKLMEIIDSMPSPDDEDDEPMPVGLVELHKFQRYGLKWLSWRERQFPGGGILGDEMGCGKTIMIVGLIMKSKAEGFDETDPGWINTEETARLVPSKSTLVVCLPTVMLQWSEEIQSKGKGLRVLVFHGSQRTTSAAVLARYDIVLTTYQTVSSEIPHPDDKSRKQGSPLSRLLWHRVVLDEAHQIRNQKTKTAQAVCQLVARHRWAVTGTPVHNAPSDFYSIVKFLRLVPFDDHKLWDFWIGLKQVRKNAEADGRLQTLGKALILRREKKNIPELTNMPQKHVEMIEVEMTAEEVRVYDHLKKFAQTMYQNFIKNKEKRDRELQGAAMAYTADRRQKKNTEGAPTDVKFSHLFALIVRMRQCAVLPHLVETMLEEEEIDEDASFDEFKDEHLISKRNPIFHRMYASSKISKILEDLKELKDTAAKENRRMDKVVIVSSWTSMLYILHEHIRQMGLTVAYITGKEKMEERLDNTKRFNNNPGKPHIILLSLSAGGAGVNLIGGNYVFFVEPHWNPMIELQAQDRVHRIGQTKDVYIRRYITKNTIESRVMELQENKINLVDTVLNSAKKSSTGLDAAQMRHLFEF